MHKQNPLKMGSNFKRLIQAAEMDLSSAEGDYLADMLAEADGDFLYADGGENLVFGEGANLSGTGSVQLDAGDKLYQFTVANATAFRQDLYLCPSFLTLESDNGHPLSGKFVSGAVATFTNPFPTALVQFYRSLPYQPLLVKMLKYSSNVDGQLDTIVTSERYNDVFNKNPSTNQLSVASYRDQYAQNSKIIDFPLNMVFDAFLRTTITIEANSQVTISLRCGAMANVGDMLQSKVNAAVNSGKPLAQTTQGQQRHMIGKMQSLLAKIRGQKQRYIAAGR